MTARCKEGKNVERVDIEVLAPIQRFRAGHVAATMDPGQVQPAANGASAPQVAFGLAPPWTSRFSGPSPRRITEIASTPRG